MCRKGHFKVIAVTTITIFSLLKSRALTHECTLCVMHCAKSHFVYFHLMLTTYALDTIIYPVYRYRDEGLGSK